MVVVGLDLQPVAYKLPVPLSIEFDLLKNKKDAPLDD